MKWQYDGDLGWWVVTAYTFPVLFLTEPFSGSVSFESLAVLYLLLVGVLTAYVVRKWLKLSDC